MQQSDLERNRLLLKNFLIHKEIPNEFIVDNPFGYIYCIENKTNHKKYIGAVYSNMIGNNKPVPYTQLRKRASNYLYEYNCVINNKSSAKQYSRPIIQAMQSEGFDNFIMYPIAETKQFNHSLMEKYFISKFNIIQNGYNVNPAGANMNKIGSKLLAKDKLLRSEGIIAINLNQKELIFSESMKLFADFINSSKDMIKNSNRKGRPYKGWFIFYLNNDKRHYVLNHNVLGSGLPESDKHSQKSKQFYSELYINVNLYLNDPRNNEYFPNFTIRNPLIYTD